MRNKKKSILSRVLKFFSAYRNYVGVDLGTSHTIVLLNNSEIVFNEPTLLAINKKTGNIDTIGMKARFLLGRVPRHIEIIQPIKRGVIYNYDVTEQLFLYIAKKIYDVSPKLFGPNFVVGVPSSVKETELQALKTILKNSGASSVAAIEEPIAAIIGSNLGFLNSKEALMAIDIGAGSTDLVVMSNRRVIYSTSINIAGDTFNNSIIKQVSKKYGVEIGIRTAEDIKIRVMQDSTGKQNFKIRGKELMTGLPKEIVLSLKDISNFINDDVKELTSQITKIIKLLESEILADLSKERVFLFGGGVGIKSLKEDFEESTRLKMKVSEDPIFAVARGALRASKKRKLYSQYFL